MLCAVLDGRPRLVYAGLVAMSEPVLRAMLCPADMLPSSAAGFLRDALAAGWDAHATIAIGPPDDEKLAVMSIVVWCRRAGVEVDARWECPADRSKPFGFSSAWERPGWHGFANRLGFREAQAALKRS